MGFQLFEQFIILSCGVLLSEEKVQSIAVGNHLNGLKRSALLLSTRGLILRTLRAAERRLNLEEVHFLIGDSLESELKSEV
jgi:hypothetical protein